MKAEITYLVANYNNGRYIKDCIDSLYAQSSNAWRCLIADDKSIDDSLAIIQPFLNERVGLLVNDENLGKTRTLMKLIDGAETDIVGILDPDDALYPTATELVLQAYCDHPEAGFVYTNYDHYDNQLKRILKVGYSTAIPKKGTSLMHGHVGALRTYRRSVYAKTTGYDPEILYAEDRDLIYKMEEVTSLIFIDQPLYKYRYVPNSQSNDPEKRRIGTVNHRRAYHSALNRRGVTWQAKVGYLLWLHRFQLEQLPFPPQIKWLIRRGLNPVIRRMAFWLSQPSTQNLTERSN